MIKHIFKENNSRYVDYASYLYDKKLSIFYLTSWQPSPSVTDGKEHGQNLEIEKPIGATAEDAVVNIKQKYKENNSRYLDDASNPYDKISIDF